MLLQTMDTFSSLGHRWFLLSGQRRWLESGSDLIYLPSLYYTVLMVPRIEKTLRNMYTSWELLGRFKDSFFFPRLKLWGFMQLQLGYGEHRVYREVMKLLQTFVLNSRCTAIIKDFNLTHWLFPFWIVITFSCHLKVKYIRNMKHRKKN